jgi:poly(hydroxyalkanoate) granule-associated protein
MNIEKHTRKLATGRVDAVRDAVEDRVAGARVRATDTWDRLEKVFEDRVQRALNKLGIPGREEVAGLNARVDALTAQLRRNEGKAARDRRRSLRRRARPSAPRSAGEVAPSAQGRARPRARPCRRRPGRLPRAPDREPVVPVVPASHKRSS